MVRQVFLALGAGPLVDADPLLASPLAGAVAAGDAFQAPEALAEGVEISYVLSGAQCPAPSSTGSVLDLEDVADVEGGVRGRRRRDPELRGGLHDLVRPGL